jgi:uncharacterized protein (TIGR01777 family)
MRKIVIAGGTGFLGSFLASRFRKGGDKVIIVSRNKGDVTWSDSAGLADALNGADTVINLAGKSVDCRYNEKNKKEILDSRVDTTKAIGEAISICSHPPRFWINSSTATIYRHAEDRPMTEDTGEIGKGFSVGVAQQWEKAFFDFHLPATRQVALRTAIVLGEGGVMKPLKRLVQFGLGGRQGRGNQMFSWIHIEDVYRIILFLMGRDDLKGVFNCSAPNPVTNEVFMKTLRNEMGIKIGLPAPAWLLETGAVIIRTETELILKSRWVIPDRLLRSGYNFSYPYLENSFEEILNQDK